ncbi:hypothetical protein J1N35_000691 [Gossypium stocksii]|uniref:Reverse transcriptase domain-containing protein n=1 Tax=Gossypium stocksii TaxID=47602 RepID=A0A9D3WJ75_9ROSI|nr:hypothetical protein J1N35_000691 [Gossypium stocksii]
MEKDQRTEGLNRRLLELGDYEISDAILEEITEIKLELNFEADRDKLFLKQMAKVNWLRLGDRNTTFFYKSATYRRRKNMIKGLENEDGILITDEEEVSNLATEYFNDLFSSKQVSNCERLFDSFSPCIKEEHNVMLMKYFKEEEVVKAIKSIAPLKALGQDGFPAIFYQKYWHIIGKEVTGFCLDVLNGRRNVGEINNTNIVLIPKEKSAKSMNKFRPISLCNVLDGCIEETQRAFVPGRQITDNIFVAYEVLHSFKKRRSNSKKSFTLKLDMSKAYDRIEWSFLEKMMRNIGFCEDWISIIMKCITSVVYTVGINGKNGEQFRPQRGLRQGDPFPYLFLICVEGFSRLIELAKREGRLSRTNVGRGNVSISHLFFADDSILFGEASIDGANNLKRVIKDYEEDLGQLVNFDKLLIYFSGNVDLATQD